MSEIYTLVTYESAQLVEQTRANILCNDCLARYIPESHEMDIKIFMIIEDDKSESLYNIQADEYKFREDKTREFQYKYEPIAYEKQPIIIGVEYNSEYVWVNGSDKLREEITLIRGLDEFELRNRDLVYHYIHTAMKYGVDVVENT